MPDDIERTIYKLELDDSAYVDGVEKTSNSTKKLSEKMEEANKKLAETKLQLAALKKQFDEVNGGITVNKSRTIELTKQLNDLKAAGKGASIEAKNLQTELRALSVSSKELSLASGILRKDIAATGTVVKTTTKEIAAMEAAGSGFAKGASKAFSGLKQLANIIPGLGISGLVLLVAGPLVNAISAWVSAMDKANFQLKLLQANQANVNEVMEAASKSAGKQITDLKILYKTATDANIPLNQRLEAVKALQAEFPDYFKNIQTETILNGGAKDSYDALTTSILATAKATAAKTKLDELEAQQLDLDFKKQKVINATNQELAKAAKAGATSIGVAGGQAQGGGTEIAVSAEENRKIQQRIIQDRKDAALAEIQQQKQLLQSQEDFLVKFAGLTNIAKTIEDKDTKKVKEAKEKQTKEIENIYAVELQKLRADIAKLDSQALTTEESVTKSIDADFKIRADAFQKAFKNKQLTAPQLQSLQQNLKNLEDLTLNAQLKSFRDQRQAYLQAINDEITNLQIEESTKRISIIEDNFERERQTIIAETDKTASALEQKRDARIAQILKDAPKNGLKPEDLAPQIQQIKDEYSKLLDDLEIIKNQKLQQLSFETFEALSEDAKRALDIENLATSEAFLSRIKAQAALLEQGKISFKQYQEALTQIAHDEANKRFEDEKAFLEAEIKRRDEKLFGDENLTPGERKKLQDEIISLRQQLANAERGNITGNKKPPPDPESPLAKFQEYANAIGSLTQSIISFWQQSNEAEQQALERSIRLQETRVDAAQRIADRGNAQYLKSETDRLNELNVARENAARKQLGIDAALQASQILVGITGAISKIATPGIGAAETIGEIAIIIGALATGYGLVKSLQGNQPRLFKGTKYLERDGAPSGKDTIPVMANEGEAVIPAETNKAYHPAVTAIYDRTIPAEDLNRFVTTYHKIKPVPQVNYERIGEAATFHMEHDGRMTVLLSEQTKKMDEHIELQKMTLHAMKKMSVSANIDRDGVAIMVNEYLQKIERDKKI